jgi:hypothetical protein
MRCSTCGKDVSLEGEVCPNCYGCKPADKGREFERQHTDHWLRHDLIGYGSTAVIGSLIGLVVDIFLLGSFPFATVAIAFLLLAVAAWADLARPAARIERLP